MPRLIAHRGFWWPNIRLQNHPAALNAALERGWDVEVDVWRVHGQAIEVGHDRPQYEWTLPSPQIGQGRLFLHLKGPSTDGYPTWSVDMELRIREVVEKAGWGERSSLFISPAVDMRDIEIVTSRHGLDAGCPHSNGIWAEQPDEDWITSQDIDEIHRHDRQVYVLSPELHGRQVYLERLMQWQEADGIVTDYPSLLSRVLNPDDAVVHPVGAWWE
jgi:glycerophosphoryl diester phosphodiesterase